MEENCLQYCVGFCHTSSWVSHNCVYFSLSPPPACTLPPRASRSPELGSPCDSSFPPAACLYTPAGAGDAGVAPGWGRAPGEGNGHPLQYPCLRNPVDRGAWWAAVCGVTESRTWLSAGTAGCVSALLPPPAPLCFPRCVHTLTQVLFSFSSPSCFLLDWLSSFIRSLNKINR